MMPVMSRRSRPETHQFVGKIGGGDDHNPLVQQYRRVQEYMVHHRSCEEIFIRIKLLEHDCAVPHVLQSRRREIAGWQ